VLTNTAQDTLAEIMWRPFRADVDPLFRPFLIRVGPERHYAGFVLNHLIGDLVSMNTLADDLIRQWTTRSVTNANPTGPTPLHYSDYILAMNEWLASPALAARMVYWESQLKGASHCRLPPTRLADSGEFSEVKKLEFSLGVERANRVYAIARRLSVTPFLVLLAAHAKALSLCSDQRDLILLSMTHGRDRLSLSNTIGSFQNLVPLRITSDEDDSLESLVNKCKQTYLEALTYAVPYHYVRGILPSLGIRECFPELNFRVLDPVLSGQPEEALPEAKPSATTGLTFKTMPARPRVSRSRVDDFQDHKLILQAHGNDIAGRVTYLPAEHDESSIARFVERFNEVIDTAAATGKATG
jgi:hypothetical protein